MSLTYQQESASHTSHHKLTTFRPFINRHSTNGQDSLIVHVLVFPFQIRALKKYKESIACTCLLSKMNVGVAHSDPNPNTSYFNSKGMWLTYVIVVAMLHYVFLSLPFLSVAWSWTLTHVSHNLVRNCYIAHTCASNLDGLTFVCYLVGCTCTGKHGTGVSALHATDIEM